MNFYCGIHHILIYSGDSNRQYKSTQAMSFMRRGNNYVCRRCNE